jgi:hypothetical protein
MAQRKLYNHLISGDIFGIRTKIKKFVKNKRMTKANNNK